MENIFDEIVESLKEKFMNFSNSSTRLHTHNEAISEAIKTVREVEKKYKNNNGGN